jgi:hypothetical protein
MPVVRSRRQVSRDALPGVRLTAAETATSTGATLEQQKARSQEGLANFGAVVANTGLSIYSAEMQRERDRADSVAILEAQRKLGEWENARVTEALNLKGKDALGLPENMAAEFEKVSGEIEKGLSTQRQRDMFLRLKTDRGLGVDLTMRRHVAQEINRYEAEELEGFLQNTVSSGALHANDPKRVFTDLAAGVEAIRTHGKNTGKSDQAVEAQVLKFSTAMHEGVIDRLLATEQDRAAKAYLAETRDQIDGRKIAEIEKALEEGSLRGEAQRHADDIINSGASFEEQRAAAKKLEPKVRERALAIIEHEQAVRDRADREQHEKWTTEGRNIIDRTGDWRSIPASTWSKLTIQETAALKAYAEHKVAQVPVKTNPHLYAQLSQMATSDDPEVRKRFQQMNLTEHIASLSMSDFQEFVKAQGVGRAGDEAKARGLLINAAAQTQMVNDALVSMGLDPTPPQPGTKTFDEQTAYRVGEFRRSVREAVSRLEQDQKKPATDEQLQSIVDRLRTPVGEKVTRDNWLWPDTKVTAFAFETAQAQATKVTDIPHGERQKIEEALRKNSLPISDDSVLRLFNLQLAKTRKDR